MQLKTALMGAGLLALMAGAAWAGDEPKKEEHRVTIICHKGGPGGPEHGGPGGAHMMVMRMHADGKKLDANGDGTITKEEFLAFHGAMFDEMDKNHDGKLTADEMHHDMPPPPHGEHGDMAATHGEMAGDMHCSHEGGGLDGDVQVHVEHGEGKEMRMIVETGGHGEHGDHMRIMHDGPGGPGGHGGGFDEMDKNHDGKISFDEFAAPMHDAFAHMDKNHDGFIDKSEWGEGHIMIRRVEKHVETKTDDKK